MWKLVVAGLCVETLETLLDSTWNENWSSLLGSSLSSSLEILSCRIVCPGCLDVCRKLHEFNHMFSLLKRCKYSLYSDTMLHYGSTNPMLNGTGRVVLVLNETNKGVCMYTWRIYSSRYLDTLLYMERVNWICIGNAVVYIHTQQ